MDSGYQEELARTVYFDRTLNVQAVKLLPGEYHVTDQDIVQVTVLGSCVAACIRDKVSGIGGMNHFMLPEMGREGGNRFGASARYGGYAMEMLINGLIKLGASRHNFEAKVFGGGNVLRSRNAANVGQRNADFVLEFLETEKIQVVAQDLVDIWARKVYYFPRTGRARVKKFADFHNQTIFEREKDYNVRLRSSEEGGEIELFS